MRGREDKRGGAKRKGNPRGRACTRTNLRAERREEENPLNGLPPSVVGVVEEEVIAMKPGNISVPLMSRVAEEGTGHVRERISSVPSVVLMCEAPTAAFFPGRAARLGFFFLAGVEDACQAVLITDEGLGPLPKSPAVRSPNHKSFESAVHGVSSNELRHRVYRIVFASNQ